MMVPVVHAGPSFQVYSLKAVYASFYRVHFYAQRENLPTDHFSIIWHDKVHLSGVP